MIDHEKGQRASYSSVNRPYHWYHTLGYPAIEPFLFRRTRTGTLWVMYKTRLRRDSDSTYTTIQYIQHTQCIQYIQQYIEYIPPSRRWCGRRKPPFCPLRGWGARRGTTPLPAPPCRILSPAGDTAVIPYLISSIIHPIIHSINDHSITHSNIQSCIQ